MLVALKGTYTSNPFVPEVLDCAVFPIVCLQHAYLRVLMGLPKEKHVHRYTYIERKGDHGCATIFPLTVNFNHGVV